MTDSWWPKRGAARRPNDPDSKGIWFRCLKALGVRPRKFCCARHTFIAWALSEGANLKGLAEYFGTSVQMIEQSYGRYTRNDFPGPLIAARPQAIEKASFAAKNRTPDRTPKPIPEERPEFAGENWWRRGELNPRPKTFRRRPLHAYSAI
jgi:hypothetical protein